MQVRSNRHRLNSLPAALALTCFRRRTINAVHAAEDVEMRGPAVCPQRSWPRCLGDQGEKWGFNPGPLGVKFMIYFNSLPGHASHPFRLGPRQPAGAPWRGRVAETIDDRDAGRPGCGDQAFRGSIARWRDTQLEG